MTEKRGSLGKAIKEAKERELQHKRDLILIKFGYYMFIYALIITFTFIFISIFGGLFI